jgi:6-phosphogluconate dehydrogenase (decarboxylating)
MRIGILHPGEMGAGIGSALVDAGHEVLWASEGRSQATRSRAEKAGLRDVESLADVTAHADMIISVCPPHAAVQMACLVAGYGGTYLDANAVAPPTAADIARLIGAGGGRYVDGGIIGGPYPDDLPVSTSLGPAPSTWRNASPAPTSNAEWCQTTRVTRPPSSAPTRPGPKAPARLFSLSAGTRAPKGSKRRSSRSGRSRSQI